MDFLRRKTFVLENAVDGLASSDGSLRDDGGFFLRGFFNGDGLSVTGDAEFIGIMAGKGDIDGEREKNEDKTSCNERQPVSRGYLFFILSSEAG